MSIAPVARPQQQSFRPPVVSLLFSAVCWVAAGQFYSLGQRNSEWWTLLAIGFGIVATMQIVKALNDQFKVWGHKRRLGGFRQGTKEMNGARFGTLEDIEANPNLSRKKGVLLGTTKIGKRTCGDVLFDGEGSMSIIMPPGIGKTMSILACTLFGIPGGNLIIYDPTGQLYSICKVALQRAGYETPVMTPYPYELSQLLGQRVCDVGFYVFSHFDDFVRAGDVLGGIEWTMAIVMPGEARMETDNEAKFFLRAARQMSGFWAMHEFAQGRQPTLCSLRSHVKGGLEAFYEVLEEAKASTALSGAYAKEAMTIETVIEKAGPQYGGAFGTAEQYLNPYVEDTPMGWHVSGSTCDPAVLKQRNKRTALFYIPTLERMRTNATTSAMALTYLFESIARDKQQGKCTALIDECGSLVMPSLADSLLYYRKSNLRCVMVWQDLYGQTEKTYGPESASQIMAASSCIVAAGVTEPKTLKMLSEMCGKKAVEDMSLTDRSMLADPMPDMSQGLSHKEMPLMRPDEIQGLPRGKLLVVGQRMHPLVLNQLFWWQRAAWKAVAGPDPYYFDETEEDEDGLVS